MAGNVKEWCANAVGDKRYILGGAWNEPVYMFRASDARPPLDRAGTNGFRAKDLDANRLAFFGVSAGATLAPIALAIEPRFKPAVLWSGGCPITGRLPEDDPITFAPRVTLPVLMLNGRDDFTFPIETSQLPMFRFLGPPETDKKRVLYDGGHVFPFARVETDTLNWLDRYLGVPK